MNILVTGATGAIGPSVLNALLEAGHRVRAFSLEAPETGLFPHGVEAIVGDITDQRAVQAAMQGMEAVVHMAALLHIVNPPPAMHAAYERINVGGTQTVVDAAVQAGLRRIVFFSTIAVYGPSGGCVLDEMSEPHPDTPYARTKLSAERIVLNAKARDGRPLGTVLRLGAVYGPRIKGNYARLLHALQRRRFLSVGRGLNRRSLVHVKDVGRAAATAVAHPGAAGRIYNVTDGAYHTLNEIIACMCSALGRRPPLLSLPIVPTRMAIHLMEALSRAFGFKEPGLKEMIDKYTEDIAVDGILIRQELGFVPRYNLQAGWKETILEMRT